VPAVLSRQLFSVTLFATVGCGGCGPADIITQYTIPKPEAIQLSAPDAVRAKPSAAARPERMLGAIVPRGEQIWFFKVSGEPDRVHQQAESFAEFLLSLRFTPQGTPAWTLPATWKQQPGSGMRFATLIVDPADPPIELTVIALPTGDGDPAEQVLANVNRWRGQLSLPPIDKDALPDESRTLNLPGGLTATVVNYTGMAKPGGMTAPFAAAGGLGRPFGPSTGAAPSGDQFSAQAPSAWTAGQAGGLRKAAFVVEEPSREEKVEITVIDLARDVGDRLANINRWRGQVALEAIDGEQLSQHLARIDVGGLPGDSVELIGPQGETILGVIVDRGDRTWFFKLQGDSALANAHKANFEMYVRSVMWK
jgi:hypothetical protein